MKQRITLSFFAIVAAVCLAGAWRCAYAQGTEPAQAPPSQNSAAAQPAADAAPGVPRIFCPEPRYDFGEVDNEQKVQHDFVIMNVGTAPLEISRVRSSCGCTVAQLKEDEKIVPPGGETRVSATLSLSHKAGPQSKPITIESNDPVNPNYTVELVGVAVAAIDFDPKIVSFGRIMDDNPLQKEITLKASKPDLTFAVTNVEKVDLDPFTAEVQEVEAGKVYKILLKSNGPLPAGNLFGRLNVITDKPNYNPIMIPVSAQIIGPLDIMPPQIQLRVSDETTGQKGNQYMRVTSGRVQNFEITQVDVPVPEMRAEVSKIKDNDYKIGLLDMPLTEDMDGKELVIHTNVSEYPEVRVPFKVVKFTVPKNVNLGGQNTVTPLNRLAPPAAPRAAAPSSTSAPATSAPAPAPANNAGNGAPPASGGAPTGTSAPAQAPAAPTAP
jgi:hypothetical protein